jgi:hypothetical protein
MGPCSMGATVHSSLFNHEQAIHFPWAHFPRLRCIFFAAKSSLLSVIHRRNRKGTSELHLLRIVDDLGFARAAANGKARASSSVVWLLPSLR